MSRKTLRAKKSYAWTFRSRTVIGRFNGRLVETCSFFSHLPLPRQLHRKGEKKVRYQYEKKMTHARSYNFDTLHYVTWCCNPFHMIFIYLNHIFEVIYFTAQVAVVRVASSSAFNLTRQPYVLELELEPVLGEANVAAAWCCTLQLFVDTSCSNGPHDHGGYTHTHIIYIYIWMIYLNIYIYIKMYA